MPSVAQPNVIAAREGANVLGAPFADFHRAAEPPRGFFERQADDGVGAAQGLEAAEPETEALVLDEDGADAEFARERGKGVERRRPVIVAMAEEALDIVGGPLAESFARRWRSSGWR